MSLALGSKRRQKENDEYCGLSEYNLSKTSPQKPAIQKHSSYQDHTKHYDSNGKQIPPLDSFDSSLNVHLESMYSSEHKFHVKKMMLEVSSYTNYRPRKYINKLVGYTF